MQHFPSFPYSLYFKTVRSVITEYGEELLYRSPNEGCAILRNSIASYLLRYRGLFAQPEQIIIGSGAEHLVYAYFFCSFDGSLNGLRTAVCKENTIHSAGF